MGPHTKGRQWSRRGTHWEVPVGEGWAWVEELGVKIATTHCIDVWNRQTVKGWEETDSGWRLCVCIHFFSTDHLECMSYVYYVHIYMHVCKFSWYGYPLPPFYLPLLLPSSKLLSFLLFPMLGIELRAWNMLDRLSTTEMNSIFLIAFIFWVSMQVNGGHHGIHVCLCLYASSFHAYGHPPSPFPSSWLLTVPWFILPLPYYMCFPTFSIAHFT